MNEKQREKDRERGKALVNLAKSSDALQEAKLKDEIVEEVWEVKAELEADSVHRIANNSEPYSQEKNMCAGCPDSPRCWTFCKKIRTKISENREKNMGIKEESGEKREFSTGAKKQAAAGKGMPVLIPPDATMELAKHFEDGAETHGARNWEKGIPLSEIMNSLLRHIYAEIEGDTGESHDRALAWNALVYLATKKRIQRGQLPMELADIPALGEIKKNPHDVGFV